VKLVSEDDGSTRSNAEELIWTLLMIAERTFPRFDAPKLLKEVYEGREFIDGVTVNSTPRRFAASTNPRGRLDRLFVPPSVRGGAFGHRSRVG